MHLTHTTIIHASIDILCTYGLADMTMRRVAKHLNVAPGALYWHFANKDELIDATARHLLDDFLHTAFPNFLSACYEFRNTISSTRDGGELISAALSSPDLQKDILRSLSAPLSSSCALSAATTALHFIVGLTVVEQLEQRKNNSLNSPLPHSTLKQGLHLITTGIEAITE